MKEDREGKSEVSSLGAPATVFHLAGGLYPLRHHSTVPTSGHSAVIPRG